MSEDSGSLRKVSELGPFSAASSNGEIKERIFDKIIPMLPKGGEMKGLFIRLLEPWPEWTLVAIGKYAGAFFPTLKPKQITDGILAFINGNFDKFDNLTHSKLIGHLAAISKVLESNQTFNGLSAEEFKDFIDSNKAVVLNHIEYILSLPRSESENCLTALAKAYAHTFDENGCSKGAKTNRPILWALIFRWPIIEKMPSVSALHDYLLKVLPAPLVGDKKRLEAICREHKIRFRERGRPKKS